MLFLEQFKNFLIIILLVAAAISGVLALTGEGDIWDPIPITVIVKPKAKSFICYLLIVSIILKLWLFY